MQSGLLDFALDLIRQAETECAETDAGMRQAAAMVYVGDVYALLVTHDTAAVPTAESHGGSRSVWPFIR